MALFEDGLFEGLFGNGLKGGLGTGLAFGLGVVVLGPVVASIAGPIIRPMAKAAIKGGLILYGQARNLVAETSEATQDLVAESRAELSGQPGSLPGEQAPPRAAASPAGPAAGTPSQEAGAPERAKPWIVRGF